jgi:glycosyltransferase involved in cell wall biosynthesis
MQDYQNYHVVYIDDASPDQTGKYVQKYLEAKKIPSDKIEVIINPENKKAMQNIYNAIHEHCANGEIVGLIDGDDSLVGRKVLQLFNAVYQQKKAALVYSNFLKIVTNNKAFIGFGRAIG